MSHWNYRILRHLDGVHMLHEVYYDDEGRPDGWTEEGAIFGASADADDPVGEILSGLRLAVNDARRHPVLVVNGDTLTEDGA